MSKNTILALAAVIILGLFGVGTAIYNQQQDALANQSASANSSALMRDYSPTAGDPNAKVTIVEFFDPACETCRQFYPFVHHIMERNPGRIKLVLRYAPLHDGSDYVIKILEASRLQNKFWETLDATFAAQPGWASHHSPQPEKLWQYLGKVGLDLEQARKDMNSPMIAERLQQDMADMAQLNVKMTPEFFVNGKPLTEFGKNQLQDLIEKELRANY